MSVEVMTRAWNAKGMSHTAKLVLLALADNANDSGVCWPSIPSIASRCALDERTVFRAIAMLEGGGHLAMQARPGKATIYHVHPLTPDTQSGVPLSESHPCQKVTPDTQSGTPDRLSPLPPSFSPPRAPPLNLPPSQNHQEPSKRGRAPKRARSRRVPTDFKVTEAMREWARGTCPEVNVNRETESFRDHEFRDPRSDWPAAWRQWMRRSPEFKSRGGGRKTFDERMAALRTEEAT